MFFASLLQCSLLVLHLIQYLPLHSPFEKNNMEFGANFEAVLAVSSYELLIKQLLHSGVYSQADK